MTLKELKILLILLKISIWICILHLDIQILAILKSAY